MSRSENEYGDVSIPRSEWAALKKAVRDAHNALQREGHALAVRLHEAVVAEAKGKRDVSWRDAVRAVSERWDGGRGVPDVHWSVWHAIFRPVGDRATAAAGGRYVDGMSLKGAAGRPPKPQKAGWPEATNRDLVFHVTDGSIAFDEKTATVRWRVDYNNHARDHAHAHPVSKALFAALERMKWTDRTGGTLYGSDEYARDARGGEGSGGDYETMRFGKDRKAYEKAFARPMTPSGGAFSPFGRRAW